MIHGYQQLQLQLGDSRKPRASLEALEVGDKVVRLLQCEAREGSEAREAGDSINGLSSKLQ